MRQRDGGELSLLLGGSDELVHRIRRNERCRGHQHHGGGGQNPPRHSNHSTSPMFPYFLAGIDQRWGPVAPPLVNRSKSLPRLTTTAQRGAWARPTEPEPEPGGPVGLDQRKSRRSLGRSAWASERAVTPAR